MHKLTKKQQAILDTFTKPYNPYELVARMDEIPHPVLKKMLWFNGEGIIGQDLDYSLQQKYAYYSYGHFTMLSFNNNKAFVGFYYYRTDTYFIEKKFYYKFAEQKKNNLTRVEFEDDYSWDAEYFPRDRVANLKKVDENDYWVICHGDIGREYIWDNKFDLLAPFKPGGDNKPLGKEHEEKKEPVQSNMDDVQEVLLEMRTHSTETHTGNQLQDYINEYSKTFQKWKAVMDFCGLLTGDELTNTHVARIMDYENTDQDDGGDTLNAVVTMLKEMIPHFKKVSSLAFDWVDDSHTFNYNVGVVEGVGSENLKMLMQRSSFDYVAKKIGTMIADKMELSGGTYLHVIYQKGVAKIAKTVSVQEQLFKVTEMSKKIIIKKAE